MGRRNSEKPSQLSAESLARLNKANEMSDIESGVLHKKRRDRGEKEQRHDRHDRHDRHHKRAAGAAPAAGRPRPDRRRSSRQIAVQKKQRKKKAIILVVLFLIVLIAILVPIGVLVVGKKKSAGSNGSDGGSSGGGGTGGDSITNVDPKTIPTDAKGTLLDPFTWKDTTGFNLTFTRDTVGGLSIMGLNSTWNDNTQANSNVPPLNKAWDYTKQPMRGVNLGGWLVIEPFITPSFFDKYDLKLGVVDEYTLSKQLGETKTQDTLEPHYATWVTEQTFKDIQAAGLDHVRIPYPYWAIETLDGDPYLKGVAWRYLLRGIEWARKYGIRVKLDLHSVPGNANGWNHSGRLQAIGWLNGTDGDLNGERTLQLHNQLSQFFSQPRYQNIITLYGLVNEPRMIVLPVEKVLNWTQAAYTIIRQNGYNGKIVFGDGFRGLENWQGDLVGYNGLVLDVHQYVIFNIGQIGQSHTGKIQFACSSWGNQMKISMDTATGFGPTMVGEWGQADTDCTKYLNNVGVGARWDGTLNFGDPGASQLIPTCSAFIQNKGTCSCKEANADPSTYTPEYKQFLLMFAQAQMDSFELGYGWVYWTWDTESAHQWSYKKGMAAGILPKVAYERDWHCNGTIPDFGILGLPETY